MPAVEIEKVSGLYGPGTYWAWAMSMISAAITLHKQRSNNERLLLPPDLMAASIYPLVSFIDMVQRTNGNDIHWAQDFQAQAAFHVVYTTSWYTGIFVLATSSKIWTIFMHCALSALFNSVVIFNLLGGVLDRTKGDVGEGKILFIISSSLVASYGLCFFIPWVHRRRFRSTDQPEFIFLFLAFTFVHALIAGVGLLPRSFSPRTGSSIVDLDQAVSLATAIFLLSYQWKLWTLIPLIPQYIASIFPISPRAPVENEDIEMADTH
jgi:hypothetical protein